MLFIFAIEKMRHFAEFIFAIERIWEHLRH